MRPIVVILVVVALGIAGLTALLLNRYIAAQKPPVQITQTIAAPVSVEILVVANDIPAGSVIKAGDLRYQAWSDNALDRRFTQRGKGEDAKAGFVGTVARRPLLAGEPLTADAVFRQDQAGVLSGMLSPGMRAMSFAVNPTSGVAGFVLPNDHVDILLNQDVNTATGQTGSGGSGRSDLARFASEVVLSDVRVLALDDKLGKAETAANLTAKTVTVEVTPKDAEVLLTASRMGELSLALRSPSPGLGGDGRPGEADPGYTSDVEVSRALQAVLGGGSSVPAAPAMTRSRDVHINRGGVPSTQSFAN